MNTTDDSPSVTKQPNNALQLDPNIRYFMNYEIALNVLKNIAISDHSMKEREAS
jgi:hypothetical protein